MLKAEFKPTNRAPTEQRDCFASNGHPALWGDIGFVGLGRMGTVMAANLAASGGQVTTNTEFESDGGKVFRDAQREVEDSLRRLRTDYMDVYQVHWPDPLIAIEETADAMLRLFSQGKIRASWAGIHGSAGRSIAA